ncbi:MAG: hypothetical protein EPO22_04700 [Dehalococcoidia bacterium]|nr:MAG: hypothetical protein EPO22_04700 [Dehalococcoidia bacterium]
MPPRRVRISAGGARQRPARASGSLTIRDFLARVHEGVAARIGPALDGFETRQRFGYLQFFRGSPDVHYEVWAQRKTARVEIGLHFEGERDRNYEAAELLALRAPDVQAAIGPEYELEEWTPAWTRLHRSFDAPSLTPELAGEAAERVVALMRGLEPIIEQMELRR